MASKERPHIEEMSILEAIDHLSSMTEIEGKGNQEALFDKAKRSLRVVHNYMKDIYLEKAAAEAPEGLHAMMALASEAREKLDKNVFKEKRIGGLAEYQSLQKFYQNKVAKKFAKELDNEETWVAEDDDLIDIERRGLRDLEMVKRDQKYELLYLKNENGKPFFTKELVRHIRLVNDFDALMENMGMTDPFTKVRLAVDHDRHASAVEIKEAIAQYLGSFYKLAQGEMRQEMIGALYNALLSLSLATNAMNQAKNQVAKACEKYFADFLFFLREALSSTEYFHLIAQDEVAGLDKAALRLLHHICYQLFMRKGYQEDAMGLMHAITEHTPSKKHSHHSGSAFWNEVLDMHEAMQKKLKFLPNGPLFKTLDVFQEGEEVNHFDPFAQDNLPRLLFRCDKLKLDILRLPCPTRQSSISKAKIVPEFYGFLRELNARKKRYLIFNLQDRTSWEEAPRCTALEKLQDNAEFAESLWVVTLPKGTDFYHQTADYLAMNDAKTFIAALEDQFANGESSGYFFSRRFPVKEIEAFAPKAIAFIHKHLFDDKKILTRRNRLDFIEAFYHLLYFKAIELMKPDAVSFTCKDGVDISAAAVSSFYAITKMLSKEPGFSGEEQDFFHLLLFAPALTMRERSIDTLRLGRTLSFLGALSADIEAEGSKLAADLKKVFGWAALLP